MSKQIYALLVGINKYNHPKISDLKGCVNDVKNMKAYLENRFENPHIKTLLNEKATYQNVIQNFRTHLTANAQKEDVVLFHYSGHGAREAAAREFKPFFPEGKEETLVCYDSRKTDGYDLADKELAVLVSEAASTGAHVVILLDCCHSGSGTRDTDDFYLGASRKTYHRSLPRPIDTYIDGYYQKQLEEDKVFIPTSKHVLLAACSRTESAIETSINTGVFTTVLLKTLKKIGNDISYASLFLKCRSEIVNEALNQTPQFDSYNYFNAHSKFLDGRDLMDINRKEVTYEDGKWVLKSGAVDGIEITKNCTPTFEIYSQGDTSNFLGFAEAEKVFPAKTHLKLDFKIRSLSGLHAKPLSMPIAKHLVYVHGHAESVKRFLAKEKGFLHVLFTTESPKGTHYNIDVQRHGIFVYFNHTNQLIEGYINPNFDNNIKFTIGLLGHILRWENAKTLQNSNTSLSSNKIDFMLTDEAGNRIPPNTKETEGDATQGHITLYLDESDFDPRDPKIAGRKKVYVKAQHFYQQELHFALVYFSEDFQIKVYANEPIRKNQGVITLWGDGMNRSLENYKNLRPEQTTQQQYLWLSKDDFEYHDVFKLIVSTEPITQVLLEQTALKLGNVVESPRRISDSRTVELLVEDWFTKTLNVRLVKRQKAISEESAELGTDNQIIIPGHPNFKAKLSLSTAQTNSRNADALQTAAHILTRQKGDLLSFGSSLGNQENVLILSEIDEAESLKKQPLELFLTAPLAEEETILSFTFDGEMLIPVGTSNVENGTTKITIDEVPNVSYPDQKRSLKKALKLVFFKFIGFKSKLQQLRRVIYHIDGSAERSSKGVVDAVAKADNILLLVHGIIGDTQQMAEAFRPAIESKKYDVVLTFDYENLNTEIEKTAEKLLSKLINGLNLRFLKDKNLDIVAHSMGGLVSRYMIEKLKGDEIVRHLFMCGTPNGGSPIANVLEYRNLLTTLMTIGVNFGFSTPLAAGFLAVLNHTKKLTVTLEQMDSNKDFIKELKETTQPKTKYTIIAGDLGAYRNKADEYAKGIVNRTLKGMSRFFHEEEQNDIAVSLESIKSVNHFHQPPPKKLEVACHHMNYFTEDGGFEAVRTEIGC